MRPDHYELLYPFVKWAGGQTHIAGIALAGACADDENEEDANLSFILVSYKRTKTLDAILRQFSFDSIVEATHEEFHLFTSLRIEYANGMEAEFGLVDELWLQEPLDEGMMFVFLKGFKVLWEREELFAPILRSIEAQKD
ncbi:hypothetical protein [Paenibacillus sp. sgz302251]|uniref:hypothetical protein n=1 Tax=Paenibacillus sp. sgz302251 TaxID=3414493 RepID=UPI003C7B9AF0